MSKDTFSEKETERRTRTVLRGAFDGPPTPLKDIPKKSGESRSPKQPARKKKI
jgi:hypothetical protein